ncbi:MAG TPA: PAS domain-containing protein, partial [Pilimelia sp.]|nr:PAS domain-containing protein [Pilimelia sp.]
MGSASGEDILARPAATGGTVDPAWLYEGGGEMRARLRAFDWANSPLGQPGQWPPDLVNALGQLLSSRAQIVLFCGPELNCFYNDAYTPVLGAKHPAALGRPAREVFAELWDVLSPLIEGVLRTGEAFWATDHPFTVIRHGYPEETYFDVSYDPVRGASGTVDGVLGIVSDTTGRVVGERRLRLLGQLGSRLADVTDAAALAREVARVLADEPADVPFARVYLQPDNGRAGAGPLALAAWSGPAPADAVPAVV